MAEYITFENCSEQDLVEAEELGLKTKEFVRLVKWRATNPDAPIRDRINAIKRLRELRLDLDFDHTIYWGIHKLVGYPVGENVIQPPDRGDQRKKPR